MFSKLLLVASAVGGLSTPLANYQHTTQEGNVNITYQYETNEVNTIDDLVAGNVYHFERNSPIPLSALGFNTDFYFQLVNGSLFVQGDNIYGTIDEISTLIEFIPHDSFRLDFDANEIYISSNYFNESYAIYYLDGIDFIYGSFDFVFIEAHIPSPDELYNYHIVDYISASDYNVITDVQEVYHTGLFGNLADFLRYHIYGGIPHVTEITFDIAGNKTTMLDWLVITTSIALAVVAIVLLFLFFRWIIKIFSNALLMR